MRWSNPFPFITMMYDNSANSPSTATSCRYDLEPPYSYAHGQVFATDNALAVVTLLNQPNTSWIVHDAGSTLGATPAYTGPLYWGQYWNSIVITISLPTVRLYVNGTLVGSSSR
jgi:hypothetical protein